MNGILCGFLLKDFMIVGWGYGAIWAFALKFMLCTYSEVRYLLNLYIGLLCVIELF